MFVPVNGPAYPGRFNLASLRPLQPFATTLRNRHSCIGPGSRQSPNGCYGSWRCSRHMGSAILTPITFKALDRAGKGPLSRGSRVRLQRPVSESLVQTAFGWACERPAGRPAQAEVAGYELIGAKCRHPREREAGWAVLAVDSRGLDLELRFEAGRLRHRDPAVRWPVSIHQELRPARQATEPRAWHTAESRTQTDAVRVQVAEERTWAEIATRRTLENVRRNWRRPCRPRQPRGPVG